MAEPAIIRWQEITSLPDTDGALEPLLTTVDTLRSAWEEFVDEVSEEEFAEARRRSLRRHAIETGIIERLYDVDRGITEALVAEGLTLEVAEREGGLDDDALTAIRTQFNALEFLAASAREGQELTVFFIRQLHEAITRHQASYEARDAHGRVIQALLHHGQWKKQPNHVIREDGSVLEYAPPEQVASEMDRLVDLYRETQNVHPLVRAAWLHHRFIKIHPFEDGNGRVGRALVLLVLLQANYAPLVVDRTRRGEYIAALDAASDGALSRLVRLFAELEIVALRSELERPAHVTVGQSPVEVARGFAERLRDVRIASDEARRAVADKLASDLQKRVEVELERLGEEMRSALAAVDPNAHYSVAKATPPSFEAKFWHAQLVRAANAANFFTNLAEGSWWVRLRLVVLEQELRFVAAIQKVGQGETGVLAVTVFSELVPPRSDEDDSAPLFIPLFTSTSSDSVTLTRSDEVDERWPEVCDLVERTLAASVAEFGRALG